MDSWARRASGLMLLDTHVLLWFREGSSKLGRRAGGLLARTAAKGGLRYSAISLMEIGQQLSKGRIELDEPIAVWRQRVLDDGINEISVNGDVALRASELSGMPGDPFDRIIAATADCFGIGLMTADAAMLGWRGSLRRFDARE